MIIKALTTETTCNTVPNNYAYSSSVTQSNTYDGTTQGVNYLPTTVWSANNTGATLLRLYNSNTTTAFLLTRSVNSTVNISSITLGPNQEMFLRKASADFLQSNTATGYILAVPVAFESV